MHQFSVTTGSVAIEYGVGDKLNNLFYGGTVSGDVYFQGKKLTHGRFILKLRPDGQMEWAQTYPYKHMRIIPDNLGGFYFLVGLSTQDFSSSTGFHTPATQSLHCITPLVRQ